MQQPTDEKPCSVCATPTRRRCTRCHSRWYCQRSCQVADWRAGHRRVCAKAGVHAGGRADELLRRDPAPASAPDVILVRQKMNRFMRHGREYIFDYVESARAGKWERGTRFIVNIDLGLPERDPRFGVTLSESLNGCWSPRLNLPGGACSSAFEVIRDKDRVLFNERGAASAAGGERGAGRNARAGTTPLPSSLNRRSRRTTYGESSSSGCRPPAVTRRSTRKRPASSSFGSGIPRSIALARRMRSPL